MQRVAIIGCGGSGKSHLARHLGAALGLPVTHLDAVYYDASWNPLPHDVFAAHQRDLVAAPTWVIDGNYASTLPIRLASADTVVFLDLPAIICLSGIAQRRLRGNRDRITIGFIRYVWTYRRSMRPRVLRLIAEQAGQARLITLPTRRSARRWLRQTRDVAPTRGADHEEQGHLGPSGV